MHVRVCGNSTPPKQAQNVFAGLKRAFFGYLIALMLILPLGEAIWMK